MTRNVRQNALAGHLRRIAQAIGTLAAAMASLMTFPSALAWMIAFWLAWHTWLIARGRPSGFPLLGCLGVLFVKRVAWIPELVALAVVMGLVSLMTFRDRGTNVTGKRRAWAGVAALWTAAAVMAWGWHAAAHCARDVRLDRIRPVACLGDSLTAGLIPNTGYPNELRRLIRLPVLDFSRPGIDSRQALGLLPRVLEARPQVVVVELGGHDFLKGYGRAATKRNLEEIITACRRIGAEVVLMEIPRGLITDPFAGLERELARQYDLELVPDTPIRKLVLWSPCAPPGMWIRGSHLSDDGLHPNAAGNRLLADEVAEALVRLYGREVLATRRP